MTTKIQVQRTKVSQKANYQNKNLTGKIAGLAGAHGSVGAVCFLTLYSFVSPQSFFKVIAAYAFLVFLALFFLKPFRVTSPKF